LVRQNKYREALYTPSRDPSIGANAMFLQIGKRYTLFLALHQFFHTLTNNLRLCGGKKYFAESEVLSL
jgi:hypothetical protein